MDFNLGEVLTRAWQISWKNKVLWWFGALMGLIIIAIFPMTVVPVLFPMLVENGRSDLLPALTIGAVVLILLFFVIMYLVGAATQTALTLGILRAQQDQELSFRDLLKDSRPFFWRVLGLMSLYAAAVMLVNLAVQALVFVLAIGTLGLGMLCATPLYLLLYPLMFAAIVWMEQGMNGIILDNLGVIDAVKQGWQLIRRNVLAMVLVMIVVYFGVGMISTIVVMPMMVPFFVIPFGFMEGEPNWTILSLSLLCGLAFTPVFALLTGWSMTFSKSAWVLTYQRLKGSAIPPQAVVQEASA